jgi:polyisoprenoid-binding protein YceI
VTASTSAHRSARLDECGVPAGDWYVDPVRSHASFTARVAGTSVRGRLPLAGAVTVAPSVEGSKAQLVAVTSAVDTGNRMLDRMLAGPGFLDAEEHPTINLRLRRLVRVPTGWRALGQMQVKGVEHPMECELKGDLGQEQQPGCDTAVTLRTRWVLDSTWITGRRVPAMSRRVVMSCTVVLDRAPADEPASVA